MCVSSRRFKLPTHVYVDIPDDIPVDFLFPPYAQAGRPLSYLKAMDNIRASAAWVS